MKLILSIVIGMVVTTAAYADPPERPGPKEKPTKVEICHVDPDGDYAEVLSISSRALAKHLLNHPGDGLWEGSEPFPVGEGECAGTGMMVCDVDGLREEVSYPTGNDCGEGMVCDGAGGCIELEPPVPD